MKRSFVATLVAVPLMSLSSLAFAATPMQLTEAQLDGVTAGFNLAGVFQYNASPVTNVQLNALTMGSGNAAYIASGNFSYLRQRQ